MNRASLPCVQAPSQQIQGDPHDYRSNGCRSCGRELLPVAQELDERRRRGNRSNLNTAGPALNWQEDMAELVRRVGPDR